jgi:hypothetical protein
LLTFEDACSDVRLYASWLSEIYDTRDLSGRVQGIMRGAGLVIPRPFSESLELAPPMSLARFAAANSPFAQDDEAWRQHCRRRYMRTDHPSLSDRRRNGAKASWGGAR